MKKTFSKSEAEKIIYNFFENIQNKDAKQVKKIKKFSMAYNIKLGEKRKLFCKNCFAPYTDFGLIVKKGYARVLCGNCNYVARWKVN